MGTVPQRTRASNEVDEGVYVPHITCYCKHSYSGLVKNPQFWKLANQFSIDVSGVSDCSIAVSNLSIAVSDSSILVSVFLSNFFKKMKLIFDADFVQTSLHCSSVDHRKKSHPFAPGPGFLGET